MLSVRNMFLKVLKGHCYRPTIFVLMRVSLPESKIGAFAKAVDALQYYDKLFKNASKIM